MNSIIRFLLAVLISVIHFSYTPREEQKNTVIKSGFTEVSFQKIHTGDSAAILYAELGSPLQIDGMTKSGGRRLPIEEAVQVTNTGVEYDTIIWYYSLQFIPAKGHIAYRIHFKNGKVSGKLNSRVND